MGTKQSPGTEVVQALFTALLSEQAAAVISLLGNQVSLEWLQAQGLLPYVSYVVRNENDLPENIANRIRSAYYAALANAEIRRRELRAILQAFAKYKIVPVAFKGVALANTVYPIPACRPMGDIDMWITSPNEMTKAQQALRQLGFTYLPKPERPEAITVRNNDTMRWFKTSPDLLVELHWGVFKGQWMRYATHINKDEILTRTIPLTICGQPVNGLSLEDSVIQLAFHFVANHKLHFPLRGLMDLALFIRHSPIDWELVVSRACNWYVQTPTWLMLKLLNEVAGVSEVKSAMTQLSPPPLRRFFLARLVDVDAILAGRDLSRGLLRFVFQFLIVDHFHQVVTLVIRTLWPNSDWLSARYGETGARIRLHHLARVLRGKV